MISHRYAGIKKRPGKTGAAKISREGMPHGKKVYYQEQANPLIGSRAGKKCPPL